MEEGRPSRRRYSAVKSLLHNSSLVLATRLLTGVIFLFASVEKAADPAAFALLIDNYKILPHDASLIVASSLPWVELVCGLAVILGLGMRGAALVLGSLTAAFTVAVVVGLLRGLDISCGCFTLDPTVSHLGWQKVAENVGLCALFAFLVFSSHDRWTLPKILAPSDEAWHP